MKKLRIKFWQNENIVMMKVLDQDESLRNKGKIFKSDSLDMAIYSNDYPAAFFESIFIRGNVKKRDNIVSSISFDSTEDATAYIEKCQELISDCNMNLEEVEIDDVMESFIFE